MQDNHKTIRDDRKHKGRIGEEVAAYYLEQQGYHVLERNWRCRSGELDIIALAPFPLQAQQCVLDQELSQDDIVEFQDRFELHPMTAPVHSQSHYQPTCTIKDSIMVIIEVRSRTGSTHGTAAESVDWRKRKQLRETAAVYAHHSGQHQTAFRYDVITVRLNDHYQVIELEHCIEAFT